MMHRSMSMSSSVSSSEDNNMMELATIKNGGHSQHSLDETDSSSNNDELRVLIYTTCYNVLDGVTITIRKLEREILAAGGHVCIVSTGSGNPVNTNLVEEHPNRTVIFMNNSLPIPFQTDPNDPSVSYHLGITLSKETQDQMDQFQPNIIHITAPDFTALHVHDFARTRNLPLMGTYHSNIADYMLFVPGMSWIKPCLEFLFRHIYNFLIHLYVPTPFIKNKLEEQGMHHVTEVKVWGRGIDLNKFKPSNRSKTFREKLNIPEETPLVLYVGRLVAEKSVDIVADVIRRLNKDNIEFRAIIVGAGPVDYLINGLPNTHHLGWLNGDELTEAYASCDIFLFPSSVETFGNVTLEAAASGLPLVVESKCSGHLVTSGVNGYPCEAGDSKAFYEGTRALCEDAELRTSYSQESIKLSETMEQGTVVRQMLDNYQEVRRTFYEDYGGSHYNRDEAYRTSKSFRFGLDPRPFGWGFIEFICFCLFRFGNFMVNLYEKIQERRNRTYGGLSGEDEDLELALSSAPDVTSNDNSTTTDTSDTNSGPGCFCSVFIAIGDHPCTSNLALCLVGIPIFFIRLISSLKRDCTKRFCRSKIENRVDSTFRRSKRID